MRVKTSLIAAVLCAAAAPELPAMVVPLQLQTAAARSIPIARVRYDVTFDTTTARRRAIGVAMTFTTAGAGDVLLSLPSWTPGAYEINNYARFVDRFNATSGSDSLDWDKMDPDTWRVNVRRAGDVRVAFEYTADSLDNAHSWSKENFAFFNGTNLFLYPEGQSADNSSTVTVHTTPGWRIATGMRATGANTFSAASYHELVDMPFFVGRFDIDSVTVVGKPLRFASYPVGSVTSAMRTAVFQQLGAIIPQQAMIFGDVPWQSYTVLQVADESFTLGAASGLEHSNSHLDIVSPAVVGNPLLPSLYAHEVFHAWNVKLLRPAAMVPYRYDVPQPTELLWISEGVTDYYADLTQLRGKTVTPRAFYATTVGKIESIEDRPPTALEDASLSAWISPVNGTDDLYYDKGSVAGLLLDILIRDASDNARSLDTVMRELYEATAKRNRGFTNADSWAAESRAAGGRSFAEFERRYIDGRAPFPYDSVLPLAGLRLMVDRVVQPSLGISVAEDENGLRVMQVVVAGPGATAGVQLGDYLVSVGGIDASDPAFQEKFNAKFSGTPPGGLIPIEIRRGTQRLTLNAPVRFNTIETRRIIEIANASPKALRVRESLLTGKPQP